MASILFKDYLRSNQLNREVSHAVRYAKETPGKYELIREHFAAVLAEIESHNEAPASIKAPAKKKVTK